VTYWLVTGISGHNCDIMGCKSDIMGDIMLTHKIIVRIDYGSLFYQETIFLINSDRYL